MIPYDLVNGLFELVGSVLIWLNVRQLHRDKMVRGVHWAPIAFWMVWGWWNLFYYPSLGQWLSFWGGVSVVIANSVWLAQMIYYGRGRG